MQMKMISLVSLLRLLAAGQFLPANPDQLQTNLIKTVATQWLTRIDTTNKQIVKQPITVEQTTELQKKLPFYTHADGFRIKTIGSKPKFYLTRDGKPITKLTNKQLTYPTLELPLEANLLLCRCLMCNQIVMALPAKYCITCIPQAVAEAKELEAPCLTHIRRHSRERPIKLDCSKVVPEIDVRENLTRKSKLQEQRFIVNQLIHESLVQKGYFPKLDHCQTQDMSKIHPINQRITDLYYYVRSINYQRNDAPSISKELTQRVKSIHSDAVAGAETDDLLRVFGAVQAQIVVDRALADYDPGYDPTKYKNDLYGKPRPKLTTEYRAFRDNEDYERLKEQFLEETVDLEPSDLVMDNKYKGAKEKVEADEDSDDEEYDRILQQAYNEALSADVDTDDAETDDDEDVLASLCRGCYNPLDECDCEELRFKPKTFAELNQL